MIPRTPVLGILNGDAPSAKMVVVVMSSGDGGLRWSYATPGHYAHPGKYELTHPESFTPLSDFGVHATLTPDGYLAVHQLTTISIATYPDGRPRHWQGAPTTKVKIASKFGGQVVDAVRLDFESRRPKVAAE